MSEICSKVETRGRPRKNADEKLPPISRKLFSEHCAVFYACCMVYVLEVFLKTKQEKRIGHSEGGFTIYEKLNAQYCFDSLEQDVREWGFWELLSAHPALWDFVRTVNGCAPRFVFRELVVLIVGICEVIAKEEISSIEELDLSQTTFMNASESDLNRLFKYIRFSPAALKELKIEKWALEVNKKIKELWRPFLKIVSYTVFCVLTGEDKSKYLKPFFSDAEHPEDTIIGQLNLEQIVEGKEEKPSPPNLGFTKIAKSEEELFDPTVRKLEFDNSPSLSDRVPLMNRRPITLITFPSNTKIDLCNSPTKLNLGHSPREEEAPPEQQQPSKKLKTE